LDDGDVVRLGGLEDLVLGVGGDLVAEIARVRRVDRKLADPLQALLRADQVIE
jgi:hypothetical protein